MTAEEIFNKHWERYNKILGGGELLLSLADQSMINKAMEEHASIIAKEFLIWKEEHYYTKNGKYRHVGDFYKNDKLKTLEQIFEEFKQYINTHKA